MHLQTSYGNIFYLDPYPKNTSPVLLLHGLGSESHSWEYQIDSLGEAGFRPLAIDLPGFGQSSSQNGWSLKKSTIACREFLSGLGINRAHIAGISMGGVVAQLFAGLYPDSTIQLVLINTFTCLRPQKIDEWTYLIRRFLTAQFLGKDKQAKIVANRLFPGPGQDFYRSEIIRQIQNSDSKIYNKALRELGLGDFRKNAKLILSPTLILTGEKDTTVAVKSQVDMAREIKTARQKFVPDCGHAMIIDRPEEVNRLILDWLINLA